MKKFLTLCFASLLVVLTSGAAKSETKTTDNKIVLTKDNVLVMDSQFEPKAVAEVSLKARELDSRLPSGDPLYLVITSGGGSIEAGIELINNLKNLNRPVHTITLFGASMAFQTAQGLGTRYLTDTGVLMSHKAKGGFEGEFPGQLDARYNFYLKRVMKFDDQVVARSGGKLTLDKYRALYANELWCQGQECVDLGVADQVVPVACDKSLDGIKDTTLSLSFMGMSINVAVKKAACPTITGVLEAKMKVNNVPVDLNNPDEWKYNPALRFMSNNDIRSLQKFVNDAVDTYDSSKRNVKEY